MVVGQGDVFWVDPPDPVESEPGFARPVVIVQGDALHATRLATTVGVLLTSNLKWVSSPGNVLLPSASTGLRKDAVANVTQIYTVSRTALRDRTGRISNSQLASILSGIDVVLGRA